MTTRWDTPVALTALLDVLEADLLSAPKGDVQAALRGTIRPAGRKRHAFIGLLRRKPLPIWMA